MSGKNQYVTVFNWQSTNPATGFLPNPFSYGSAIPVPPVLTGAMASTNTIYSNIIDLSRMDSVGIEIAWTGTPTGVLSVSGSVSGLNFPTLTFNPALAQPAGSASSYLISLQQFPFKYIMLTYVNASGTGVLSAFMQNKDLN